jgi:hypothetical protein
MIPMKAFSSEAALLAYARISSPAVVARPAIVPYIRLQLEGLDMLVEEDSPGTMYDSTKVKGEVMGKQPSQLYRYNRESRADSIWTGPSTDGVFIPAIPILASSDDGSSRHLSDEWKLGGIPESVAPPNLHDQGLSSISLVGDLQESVST